MNKNKQFASILFIAFIIMSVCCYQLILSINTYTITEEKLNEINVEQYHINHIEKVLEAVNDITDNKSKTTLSSINDYNQTNIFYDNGFKVKDSKLLLSLNNKTVSFILEGAHSVNLDTSKYSVLIDDSVIVELSNKVSDIPDETCVIRDENENPVVIGKINVDENLSLSLYYPTNDDNIDKDVQKSELLLKSARIEESMPVICFEDINLSNSYQGFIIESSAVQITAEESPICFYGFNSEYTGAGFKEISFKKAKLLFSKIKDNESGYSPYLLKTSDLTFEILAKSQEDIKLLFD